MRRLSIISVILGFLFLLNGSVLAQSGLEQVGSALMPLVDGVQVADVKGGIFFATDEQALGAYVDWVHDLYVSYTGNKLKSTPTEWPSAYKVGSLWAIDARSDETFLDHTYYQDNYDTVVDVTVEGRPAYYGYTETSKNGITLVSFAGSVHDVDKLYIVYAVGRGKSKENLADQFINMFEGITFDTPYAGESATANGLAGNLLNLVGNSNSAQTAGVTVGPVRVSLPEDVQVTEDRAGIFFTSDEQAEQAFRSLFKDFYLAVTNRVLKAEEADWTDSFVVGAVFTLDADVLERVPFLSHEQFSQSSPKVVDVLVDGRPAYYTVFEQRKAPEVQFVGIIQDRDATIVVVSMGSADRVTEEDMAAMFTGITFEAVTAQATAEPSTVTTPNQSFADLGVFAGLSLQSNASLPLSYNSSAELSPDGRQVAFFTGDGLCLQALDEQGVTGETQCAALEHVGDFAGHQLRWSPDGRYIVFTEIGARRFIDTDIWVFDVNDGSITNRTNDNVTGTLFPFDKITQQGVDVLNVDFAPLWAGDTLYFFRSEVTAGTDYPTRLYRMSATGNDEPELVAAFGTGAAYAFSVMDTTRASNLDGAAAISPSGRWLATVQFTTEGGNLLRFDLDNGTVEQIATGADFQAGMPAFVKAGETQLLAVSWLPDESGLLVGVDVMQKYQAIMTNLYRYDFASGDAQPLMDFSSIESADDLQKGFKSGSLTAPSSFAAIHATLLPDGSAVVFAGYFRDVMALWSVALPANDAPYSFDNPPQQVGVIENAPPRGDAVGIYQQGATVRLLVGNQWLTLERLEG